MSSEMIIYGWSMTCLRGLVYSIFNTDNKHMTCEKLVAAAIKECIDREIESDISEDEFGQIFTLFGESKARLKEIYKNFTLNIDSYDDCETYYRLEKQAYEQELYGGGSMLHASYMLRQIFSNPTPAIKALTEKYAVDKESNGELSDDDDVTFDISDFIDSADSSKDGIHLLTLAAKMLQAELKKKIVGQDHAVNTFSQDFSTHAFWSCRA